MAVLLIGAGLAIGHIWTLLVVPIFILLVQQIWIVKEEESLEATFGQIYRNYKMRVRRWLYFIFDCGRPGAMSCSCGIFCFF
jgi:protein-S-isoprenylcysteine O-methyltransferase Ste14